MDRRSWPWKKKSSDKHEKEASGGGLTSNPSQKDTKKPTFVQVSVESYNHLTNLEEEIKASEEQIHSLEDEIKDLNEKLTTAQSEITTKEELVKQHAKVAEEAVSGWEKAEAEALALKNHLETVTLSKLAAENRSTQLDDALKECMKQIRALKEDHEMKIQDLVFTKNKHFDKMKSDLESRLAAMDQELHRSAVDHAAVSRSLQERSAMLIKISEEKSQAEARIEMLNSNIESCEKEISSIKYELHIAAKELEIRTEEKNMSIRSADVANKQHSEAVKKIAKLEAECQRLRGLVRKKLPGPAALAQMKQEVESMGRDFLDPRGRRASSSHYSPFVEYKETEFLTQRILGMEEETKMLKEALADRNTELLNCRNMVAKAESRVRSLEVQIEADSAARNLPEENDDNASFVSFTTAKSLSVKSDNKHLELMDDFLEMEKLAHINEKVSAVDQLSDEMISAVEKVNEFVLRLGKESDPHQALNQTIDEFAATVSVLTAGNPNLSPFVLSLSHVLEKAMDERSSESDTSSPDCIDKVALPENKPSVEEQYENACGQVFPDGENPSEKENLEVMKRQLSDTEQLIVDLKSQLDAATNSRSLSETQLKCMVESYRILEIRASELQAEVNELTSKVEALENERRVERDTHSDTLAKLKELEEQFEKNNNCNSNSADHKAKQDRELAAAAEKLAECQETILMLGKQLKSMHPEHDFDAGKSRSVEEAVPAWEQSDGIVGDTCNSPQSPEADACSTPMRSPINGKYSSNGSGASSAASTPTPEKTRGFTRFFASKGKNGY